MFGLYQGKDVNTIACEFLEEFPNSSRTKQGVKTKTNTIKTELLAKLLSKEETQLQQEKMCMFKCVSINL